jgi:hypothetical protein
MSDTDLIQDAVNEAIAEMATQPTPDAEKPKAGPKPKAEKPKAGPKPKAERPKAGPKPKAEKPAPEPKPEPKPEPLMIDGFEVKEGTDLAFIYLATKTANEAIEAINQNEADLLKQYLSLGMFQSSVVDMFASKKVYGQYVAAKVPDSVFMDAALRSNCKWLWQALNKADHEAADILTILGVNRIEDFKSANPTVIRREYREMVETAKAKAKAEAEGKTVEELEAEAEAKEAEAKKKAEAEGLAVFSKFVALFESRLPKKTLNDILLPVLKEAVSGKKDGPQVLAMMRSVLPVTGDDTDH